MKRPRLYHLTAEPWWILIAQTGVILSRLDKEAWGLARPDGPSTTTLGGMKTMSFPRVFPEDSVLDGLVWLTQNATPTQGWQIPMCGPEDGPAYKGAIRIEVECPEAVRWDSYVRRLDQPFNKRYLAALNVAGDMQSGLWWVIPGPIESENWVQVVRTSDGAVLYDRDGG